jgi:LysM repeat protein
VSAFRKVVCVAVLAMAVFAARARAAVPHTVVPGETLWSIASANNFPTQTLAAYNGLSEDSQVYVGETIQIPTEAEGATAPATSITTSSSSTSSTTGGISHTVQTGESLSSIAAANGISPYTLAADNGLSSDALLTTGQQLTIPATSSSTSTAPTPSTTSSGTGTATSSAGSPPPEEHPSWTSPIYCPSCPNGEAYLSSNAAYNWNAMRQASLDTYGIDLYPAGPFSAYRSYSQQLYLYNLYLAGQGSLAAVPGSSSHEYGSAVDLADPSMRTVIDQIGATYGWAKTEASDEWWHVNYVGP